MQVWLHHILILGGDFNVKATEWGSPIEDRRGSLMTEWLIEANMVVLNLGNQLTFVRYNQQLYIDVTICTEGVVGNIKNCRVRRRCAGIGLLSLNILRR